jgi:hypothetical protein
MAMELGRCPVGSDTYRQARKIVWGGFGKFEEAGSAGEQHGRYDKRPQNAGLPCSRVQCSSIGSRMGASIVRAWMSESYVYIECDHSLIACSDG